MQNREQYKRLIKFSLSVIIVAVLTGIFAITWFWGYAENGANYFVRGNYVLIMLYALMICFVFKFFGGFRIGSLRIVDVLFSQVLSVLVVNASLYIQLCLIVRWKWMTNMVPLLIMTAVDLVVVIAWVILARWGYLKVYPSRSLLVVYGDYSPDRLIHKLRTQKEKYDIRDAVSIDSDMDVIKEKILENGNVVLTDIPAQTRNELLKFCFENSVRCYCVPKISDIMITSAERIHLLDTTMLLFRNMGMTAEQRFLKRVMDIIIVLIAAVVAAPFMLVIALCIKLYDGGPVLFTQDRLTQDGKVFKLYKFRSMKIQQDEQEYCMTRKDDDRITPVGKIIRAIHFDELPQILNILKGDMSVVGPRPECPDLAEKYCETFPEFRYRLKVKAGLTGYAQVYGKYNTTPYDKLKLDLTYIENYSILLDLKLILLTVKVLFQKENTEGIESWQTSAENAERIGTKK